VRRRLSLSLSWQVDVVVEVRDARIPQATAHPLVSEWVGLAKPLLVCFTRVDMVPKEAVDEWRRHLATSAAAATGSATSAATAPTVALPAPGSAPPSPPPPPPPVQQQRLRHFWVDATDGSGVLALRKAVVAAGEGVNARRAVRGLKPRPVRAAVIGFPNVGKSTLVNRLIGRRRAPSADKPGVTRSLNWLRLGRGMGSSGGAVELLDSPGIIPARQVCGSKRVVLLDGSEAAAHNTTIPLYQ